MSRYKLLLLTYEGQKPPKPEFHAALAKWVREWRSAGGGGRRQRPYNAVREWWNTAPYSTDLRASTLFETLGIPKDPRACTRWGEALCCAKLIPAALTYKEDGAETVRKAVRQAAAEAVKLPWKETNSLVLRRGPYLVAAGLEQSRCRARSRTSCAAAISTCLTRSRCAATCVPAGQPACCCSIWIA